MTSLERPDFLMQVGAYMARNSWPETARVYLQKAGEVATRDRDFEVQYSIGEYFHNVEEDVKLSAKYFMSSATQALNILSEKGSAAADNAREKLRAVIKLVPEREEQSAIITSMVEKR